MRPNKYPYSKKEPAKKQVQDVITCVGNTTVTANANGVELKAPKIIV
ncbi:hypothetical protein [Streptococcus marmotae]|nr:hypothetical protein [Streptococcus marmotae]